MVEGIFQDYRWFSRMDRELKDSLKDRGLYIRAGPVRQETDLIFISHVFISGTGFPCPGGSLSPVYIVGAGCCLLEYVLRQDNQGPRI